MGGTCDADNIRETVHAYFDPAPQSRVQKATGKLAKLDGLLASLPHHEEIAEHALDVFGFELVQVDEIEALARMDATWRVALVHPFEGGLPITLDVSGPVRLRCEVGEWKLTDWTRMGRSVADSFFPKASGVNERRGIRVRTIGAYLRSDATQVILEFRNRRVHPVHFAQATLLADAAEKSQGILGEAGLSVPAGATVVDDGRWPIALPLDTRRLVIELIGWQRITWAGTRLELDVMLSG